MAIRALSTSFVIALAVATLTAFGCGDDNDSSAVNQRADVEVALDAFAADLAATPIDPDELYPRIRAYLQANPDFFGSTVALLGEDELTFYSPYVYRLGNRLGQIDLAYPEYDIDNQEWLVLPRDTMRAVWSPPYFDAGGGEIWMQTRSVPLLDHGTVYAVVTTDLPVDPPAD